MSIIKSALTAEQLANLKFIDEQISVFPKKKSGYVAHTMSHESLGRVVSLLSGRDTAAVLKKDMKLFFIPDGSLKMDDYKEYCRQNGYKITGHPKNADAIIGHDNWYNSSNAYYLSYRGGEIAGRLFCYTDSVKEKSLESVTAYIGGAPALGEKILFGANIESPRMESFYFDTKFYTQDALTDKFMEIVYWKLAKKIPVVNEQVFLDSLEKIVIDEAMYETINSMVNSTDKNDVSVGFDLMCRSDIMKSAQYLRLIYNSSYHNIRRRASLNTKLARNFTDKVNEFHHLDDPDFIMYMQKENALTEELYYSLSRSILKDLINHHAKDTALSQVINVSYTTLTYEEYMNQHKPQQIINSL
jgi:hypothetical protein